MLHEQLSGRASRLLRPVLLGSAAAAVWLALSAPTANAETGPLLDELSGSLESRLSATAPWAPAVAPQSPPPGSGGDSSGLLSPVSGTLPGAVDRVVGPITAVTDVPSGALTDPAAGAVELVDGAAVGAVQAVIPIASGLLPASAGLVDPLAGPLASIVPLPAAPYLPSAAPAPAAPVADPGEATTPQPGSLRVNAGAGAAPPRPVAPPAASPDHALPSPSDQGGSREAEEPVDDRRTGGVPDTVPAIPGSGAGSGQSASGPGTGAAAETTVFLLRPPPGMCETSNPLHTAPEPVSFDPGSSPD